MKRFTTYLRNLSLKNILAGFLVTITIFGSGAFALPKQADALFGVGDVVFDPSNFVKNTITSAQAAITAGLQGVLNTKEITLDGIAFSLAKKVLAQGVRSTIDWINSGFNGSPAFITDLDQYFLNAADEVAGDFIAASNFAQLCRPLQMPVRFILDLSYRQARSYRERSQCTLSGAVGNVEAFMNGNFSEGGWTQWFSIIANPENNIYGAAALGRAGLYGAVDQAQENAKTESLWGNGFLSMKDCSSGKCIVVTPGNVISEYLNFNLTVGDRVLIESDEINELVGALFSQLGNQAIAGVGGLLGMSSSPDGTTPSYLSQFEQETLNSGFGGDIRFLTDAIRIEDSYTGIHEKAVDDLDDVLADLAGATCSGAARIANDAVTLQESYEAEIDIAASVLSILELLRTTFTGSNDAQVKVVVVEEFQRMQSEGVLHSNAEVVEKTFEIADEVTAIQNRANSCN